MSNLSYIIRNYRLDDLDNYIHLYNESIKLCPTGRYASPQVLRESLRQPNYSPEQGLFVAEIAGEIIGSINVLPELGIRRVIFECLVHPKYCKRGLVEELFNCALRRARELEAQVAHVCTSRDNITAKNLISRLGFRFVRRFLELRLEIPEVLLPNINNTQLSLHHLPPNNEGKLAQLQNRCFEGTWGYNPNTPEEIIYHINLANYSLEDIILASKGEKYVGYCWTWVNTGEDATTGGSKGRIYMLGVDPNYRGEGIGKELLLAGLLHLKNKGVKVVELTVDSKNKIACNLYRSIGFRAWTTSLWYEMSLDRIPA